MICPSSTVSQPLGRPAKLSQVVLPMRRFLLLFLAATALSARAADDESNLRKKAEKADKDAELKKKTGSIAPDKSLAGDITRKKVKGEAAPALQYDTFRLGVESQVATKRTEQIRDLK